MQQHLGAMSGGADQSTQALIYFLQSRDAIDAVEGVVAGNSGPFELGEEGALAGVYFRKRRPDDHGVRDFPSQQVNAFGETAA